MTTPLTALLLILGIGSFTGKYAVYYAGVSKMVVARALLVIGTVCVLMLPLELEACSAWRLPPADASLGSLLLVGSEVLGTATQRRVGTLACAVALVIAFASAEHAYTTECSAALFGLSVVGMACAPLLFFNAV